MSQDLPLPLFHFILHTFNILHLSFTFYILCHKISFSLHTSYCKHFALIFHISYSMSQDLPLPHYHFRPFEVQHFLYVIIRNHVFYSLSYMIHTSQIFTSYYPGTIPLLQFLCQTLNRV